MCAMSRRWQLFFILLLGCTAASAQFFSMEARKVAGSQRVVMDFLERYFVDLLTQKETTIERKMMDDKVYFRKGGIKDLRQVNDTVPCSITLLDRYYEVKWMRDHDPFITLVFPAQYDLLLGMGQEEAQQKLKDVIIAAQPDTMKKSKPSRTAMVPIPLESLYKYETDTFQLASLSNATYYYNNVEPVFDARHPDYSAANLFAGLIPDTDSRMYVEQSVYGLKTISYTITLRQWLNYCAEWGLKVFFAVEEQREDGLLLLVIARSEELGFNHMLSVVLPDKFTSDKKAVLKVRLTPYIPTHNLKNLYQQQPSKRNKIKWQ